MTSALLISFFVKGSEWWPRRLNPFVRATCFTTELAELPLARLHSGREDFYLLLCVGIMFLEVVLHITVQIGTPRNVCFACYDNGEFFINESHSTEDRDNIPAVQLVCSIEFNPRWNYSNLNIILC